MSTPLDLLRAPWAIEPEILTEMCAIYARHRAGETVDIKAIEAQFGRSMSNEPKPYDVQDGVATIPVQGVLSKRMSLFAQMCGGMSYTSLQQDLAKALADSEVTSIILAVDSPGGAVDGLQAAGDAIYGARGQKPIIAYVDGKATSAAYWLASAADAVYIGSDADAVGSIGVIMTHLDTSAADTLRGLKYTDLTAGRYKAAGSSNKPLSGQDFSVIQDQLDHLYGIFVDTVARNRGVDGRTVANKMADGRVFLGQRAIDAGLVDGKASLSELIGRMNRLSSGRQQAVRRSTVAPPRTSRNPDAALPTTSPAALSTSSGPAIPNVIPQVKPNSTPVPRTAAEVKVEQLQSLKTEGASIQRLLAEAQANERSCNIALNRAIQERASAPKLEPLISDHERAKENVRELRSRLNSNEAAQLAALRA